MATADSSKGGNTYLAGLPRDGGARVGFCGGPMATLGDIDKGWVDQVSGRSRATNTQSAITARQIKCINLSAIKVASSRWTVGSMFTVQGREKRADLICSDFGCCVALGWMEQSGENLVSLPPGVAQEGVWVAITPPLLPGYPNWPAH